MSNDHRLCAACKSAKPLSEFGRKGTTEHGRPTCRACNIAASALSRERWAARKAAAWLEAAAGQAALRVTADRDVMCQLVDDGVVPHAMAAALVLLTEQPPEQPPEQPLPPEHVSKRFATVLHGIPEPRGRHTFL